MLDKRTNSLNMCITEENSLSEASQATVCSNQHDMGGQQFLVYG